jgi:hypothetical protein
MTLASSRKHAASIITRRRRRGTKMKKERKKERNPVVTHWETWLEGMVYCVENFETFVLG